MEEPRDIGQSGSKSTTRRGSRSDRRERERPFPRGVAIKRAEKGLGGVSTGYVAAAPAWERAEGSGRAVMWSWASTRGQGARGLRVSSRAKGA